MQQPATMMTTQPRETVNQVLFLKVMLHAIPRMAVKVAYTSNEDTVFQYILCQHKIVEFPTLDDVGLVIEVNEKEWDNRLSI